VVARPSVEGVCAVIVQESFEIVVARVILCSPDGDWDDGSEPLDCPARVWLDDALEDREVIDVESGRRLPLYVPNWS